jgi:hypothetical protein
VRVAVRAALAGYGDVDEAGDRFETGWSVERVAGEQGIVLGHGYRYRERHEVVLAGAAVEVRSSVVRRAPGGPRANRWERADPARAQQALLDAVAKELEKAP